MKGQGNGKKMSYAEWVKGGRVGPPPSTIGKSGRGVSRETAAQRKARTEKAQRAKSRVKRRPTT